MKLTFLFYFFDTLIQFLIFFSCFKAKCLKKIVVGKVIVAKAIGIYILYIGKFRFVINRPGREKRITQRNKIN